MSSPGPKRSTPVSEVEEDDDSNATDPQEKSAELIKFQSNDNGSVLQPPTEKPPAVPRDAGTDLMDESQEQRVGIPWGGGGGGGGN
jgi:hypothetical protein